MFDIDVTSTTYKQNFTNCSGSDSHVSLVKTENILLVYTCDYRLSAFNLFRLCFSHLRIAETYFNKKNLKSSEIKIFHETDENLE